MKYVKSLAFFITGASAATILFYLVLMLWGDDFEHAAPLVTDGFIIAWAIFSCIAGGLCSWFAVRKRSR